MAAMVLPPNPNPTRISDAIWRLWNEFDRYLEEALLSGIYAPKPGYHNYRNALPAGDYSVQLVADRRGSGSKASALDITLSEQWMKTITARLDKAARARDPRLYTSRGPVLREFIGTLNGTVVYCYVLTGGRALGVNGDAGPDPGRAASHLWHAHLSIIREFCEDWAALSGVLSVLVGESLADWQAGQGDDVATIDNIWNLLDDGRRPEGQAQTAGGGVPVAWIVRMFYDLNARLNAIVSAISAIDEETAARIKGELDQVDQGIAANLAAIEATPSQVIAQLTAVGAENGAAALVAALGEDEAREFAEAVLRKTGTANGQ